MVQGFACRDEVAVAVNESLAHRRRGKSVSRGPRADGFRRMMGTVGADALSWTTGGQRGGGVTTQATLPLTPLKQSSRLE